MAEHLATQAARLQQVIHRLSFGPAGPTTAEPAPCGDEPSPIVVQAPADGPAFPHPPIPRTWIFVESADEFVDLRIKRQE